MFYHDTEGNYYCAKSDPITVSQYEISVKLFGANENNEIEVGDTLTLEYEVTGGNDDFTLTVNWELNFGETSTHTESISSSSRTGSTSFVPQGEVTSVGYQILIWHNWDIMASAYIYNRIQVTGYEETHDHSSDILFINSTDMTYAGDTVTVTYKILRDDITITDAWWKDGQNGFETAGTVASLTDRPIGTTSHNVGRGDSSWLEVFYHDTEGNYYCAKSDPITVSQYEISVKLFGANENNEIEVGDTLTLEYEVTGGNDDFTLTVNWELNFGETSTHTESISSSSRTGSTSFVPQGEVTSVGYQILIWHNYDIMASAYSYNRVLVIDHHSWQEPFYEWTGNSTVTATRMCANNPNHTEKETTSTINHQIISPTQNETGMGYYSAVFENDAFAAERSIIIPALKDMTILQLPAELKTIESEAFVGIDCEAVIIPDGCISIYNRAFAACPNLKYVRIPASVTNLAENAFEDCNQVVLDFVTPDS